MIETNEKPLVTFALFAYNQEKYIREAIEGAFAQDYSPLEIILSDDCSTDRTFEIMQEMAAGYDGKHKIIVRRNYINLGTALHVYSAFIESKGELFVVAAGDDISLPNRVLTLFNTWNHAGSPSGVVHSGWESFRQSDGMVLGRFGAKRNAFTDNVLYGYAHSQWLPAAAPTSAYTRDVFERFGPLTGGSIIEDAPLFLRAALIGRFVPCDEVLLRQRIHEANSGKGHRLSEPARWNRFIQSKLIAFRNMQSDLNKCDVAMDARLRDRIEQRILAVARSASTLFLPEINALSFIEKLCLALRLVSSPAVSYSFMNRVNASLVFFGFEFHLKLKARLLRKRMPERRWH